jgi:BirA family biotin operon repressor/biotin-[acetyl-CoA-carboxylase] ligase
MQAFRYISLDSTQNQAKRLIDDASINHAYIVASEQTAGRGQYGKSWASPQGAGIYLSIVTLNAQSSTLNENSIQSLTVGAAEKVIKVLNEFYKADYYIKPINDIYYDGCKLAGILVEIYKGYTITGIGVNLRNVPRTLKETIIDQPKAPPISLEEIFPEEIFLQFKEQSFIDKLLTEA